MFELIENTSKGREQKILYLDDIISFFDNLINVSGELCTFNGAEVNHEQIGDLIEESFEFPMTFEVGYSGYHTVVIKEYD